MWGKKEAKESETQARMTGSGGDFESAAARVSAAGDPLPDGAREVGAEGAEAEFLEITEEWAEKIVRAPFLALSKVYHPAFELSDEQAKKLGPKALPVIKKATDIW